MTRESPELQTGGHRLRRGPLAPGAFKSRLHSQRIASLLGISLGVTFTVCFITGLLSDAAQNAPFWSWWPARPAGLYRITQGLHIATGIASIPLLLAKLWTVYPRLWAWPLVEGLLHALERVSLIPLVAGSIFLLFSGVWNIALWYPWGFFFPTAHYWTAWITTGALIVHIGAKATIARHSLRKSPEYLLEPIEDGMTRRGFLAAVSASAALLTLTTAGQTLRALNPLGFLAPLRPNVGPQGFPVFRSAKAAGVTETARKPDYRLSVEGSVSRPLELSLDQLRAMPHREATLAITCVNGWSANVRWKGVSVAEILRQAGGAADSEIAVESIEAGGAFSSSHINATQAQDPDTMLALEANGEPLHIDHGFPVRLIGPNRPGVTNTKWVEKLVVI